MFKNYSKKDPEGRTYKAIALEKIRSMSYGLNSLLDDVILQWDGLTLTVTANENNPRTTTWLTRNGFAEGTGA